MKKYISLTVLAVVTAFSSLAQDDDMYKEPSRESQDYHNYRLKISRPGYSSKKIVTLVNNIKSNEEDYERLSAKQYQDLTLREKFTYNMTHAESYSQNCDATPPLQDEHKKIFGQLLDAFGEWSWSDRQETFFKTNRDSVMLFIQECVAKDKYVGLNCKHVIVDVNATEMIPFLITAYNFTKKDHDILTILMLLMEHNSYPVFLASTSHKKLYGDQSDYRSFLVFNTANQDLIIQRATDFYNGLKH